MKEIGALNCLVFSEYSNKTFAVLLILPKYKKGKPHESVNAEKMNDKDQLPAWN